MSVVGQAQRMPLFSPIQSSEPGFRVQYSHPNGKLIQGDCLEFLPSLPPESVDLVFADPPYNLGKAAWDTFSSHDEYIRWSLEWIRQAARVLKPSGSLYVCGFTEILADIRGLAAASFKGCRWLIWNYRNKANLSNDWGRSHESIIHFRKSSAFKLNIDDVRIPYGNHTRKYPSHPQANSSQYGNGKKRDNWEPNLRGAKPRDVIEIPTICNGMTEKTPHPTQKPEELIRKLILAASASGELVLDPFSGSGTTTVVAEQLSRKWLGCEINAEYNEWAIQRLETVQRMSVEAWLEFDRKNAERRESIR